MKKETTSKNTVPNFITRTDHVGHYFEEYLKDFVFDEFSEAHLKREGILDIMKGVPIPLRHQDVVDFHGKKGLSLVHIAENMAWIMGINPQFQYVPQYVAYLKKYFNHKIVDALVKEGRDHAEEGKMDSAVIHFRAALVISPDNLHAMYSYARGCRELYEEGSDREDSEYVGRFKAESIEYFELTTIVHPDFAQSYYFLGYAYLNMGLYIKASLTWKQFLERSKNKDDKKEIHERLEQLTQPIEIEKGCNHVLAGRFADGIKVLKPFTETQYETWWPLHYYLGVGFSHINQEQEAIASLKRALELNPSHIESMKELADIYEQQGEESLAEKYRKKIQVVIN
ncbi:tetratricopeptide repeat protein [Anaerovorax sp. IOR16]|uniref:tetratricopeptide repeat protein n=1 Tax=Anaerovorax sp. IOR16 TaxID=2773458 RepID=UPI0019CFA82E|nr:tetratricopeptide repeat protein [Anaerovorax sp. IOR16]